MNRKTTLVAATTLVLGAGIYVFAQQTTADEYSRPYRAILGDSGGVAPQEDGVNTGVILASSDQDNCGRIAAVEQPTLARYQAVKVTDKEIILLDVITGSLYAAKAEDIKPFKQRPGESEIIFKGTFTGTFSADEKDIIIPHVDDTPTPSSGNSFSLTLRAIDESSPMPKADSHWETLDFGPRQASRMPKADGDK